MNKLVMHRSPLFELPISFLENHVRKRFSDCTSVKRKPWAAVLAIAISTAIYGVSTVVAAFTQFSTGYQDSWADKEYFRKCNPNIPERIYN